jgi:hypothetical protein
LLDAKDPMPRTHLRRRHRVADGQADGDVYFGVLAATSKPLPRLDAALDAGLTVTKTPGGFGWDDAVDRPASAVASLRRRRRICC